MGLGPHGKPMLQQAVSESLQPMDDCNQTGEICGGVSHGRDPMLEQVKNERRKKKQKRDKLSAAPIP